MTEEEYFEIGNRKINVEYTFSDKKIEEYREFGNNYFVRISKDDFYIFMKKDNGDHVITQFSTTDIDLLQGLDKNFEVGKILVFVLEPIKKTIHQNTKYGTNFLLSVLKKGCEIRVREKEAEIVYDDKEKTCRIYVTHEFVSIQYVDSEVFFSIRQYCSGGCYQFSDIEQFLTRLSDIIFSNLELKIS